MSSLSTLRRNGIKLGNLIIRENEIVLSYTYAVLPTSSCGCIGIDLNFNNITTFDGEKEEKHDISEITNYKQKVRETLAHFKRNDDRIQSKLKQKYGRKQRNREQSLLHGIANKILSQEKMIVFENLKYIRNRGKKGNSKGKEFRFKLHMWSRFKFKHIVVYKSIDNGRKSIFINPKGTSSKCSTCGAVMIPEENRLMRCSACSLIIDRDKNAARNIYQRGLRFWPIAQQGEGMKQSKDVDQIAVSYGRYQGVSPTTEPNI